MLSNKEKERIKEEEIFRAKVQKGLAVPQNKLIKFLNSSLGIWLLSTLVLGFYGWAYSSYQTSQQNEEIVRKLDIEIEARLGSGALQLEKILLPLVMFTSKLRVPDGDYQHHHIVVRL
jgi:hypothetical protein